MLERAKEVTRSAYTVLEYARYADDLVVLVTSRALVARGGGETVTSQT